MKKLSRKERTELIQKMAQEYVNELAALSDAELILHGASLQKHKTLPDENQADIGRTILKDIWT